ncbi:hypothetical protein Aperf_G00000047458 [Anoplocephala perfoliata]
MEEPSDNKSGHILTGKCVVVGDERIGKTCFISRLRGQPFRSEYSSTLVDMAPLRTSKDGTLMLVDCWDTPGAHNLESIRLLAYQNAHVFAICFSVVIPESFQHVRSKWLKEIRENGPRNADILLIGLQSDLRGDEMINKELISKGNEMPTIDECFALAANIGAVNYFECSSKTHMGFDNILDAMKTAVRNPTRIVRHVSVSYPKVASRGGTNRTRKNGLYYQRTSEP